MSSELSIVKKSKCMECKSEISSLNDEIAVCEKCGSIYKIVDSETVMQIKKGEKTFSSGSIDPKAAKVVAGLIIGAAIGLAIASVLRNRETNEQSTEEK